MKRIKLLHNTQEEEEEEDVGGEDHVETKDSTNIKHVNETTITRSSEHDNHVDYITEWNQKKRSRSNQYMHPNNIYKNNPPNFKQLSLDYPEFDKFILDKNEKIYNINWNDPSAIRELTRILLIKDFQLEVELSPTHLCPTITSRLNYLLWLNDILNHFKEKNILNNQDQLVGIDIGTGTSCIYPLLGQKLFKWNFLAIDIDKKAIELANLNITKNNFNNQITCILNQNESNDSILNIPAIDYTNKGYDFCVCNPPFFEDLTFTNLNPNTKCIASENEFCTKGGEFEFIKQMIKDSLVIGTKISIYSSLIGRKSNCYLLAQELKQNGINQFKTIELTQGQTSRWVLFWTLHKDSNLSQFNQLNHIKNNNQINNNNNNQMTRKQLRYASRPIYRFQIQKQSIDHIQQQIQQYLGSLNIQSNITNEKSTVIFNCTIHNWLSLYKSLNNKEEEKDKDQLNQDNLKIELLIKIISNNDIESTPTKIELKCRTSLPQSFNQNQIQEFFHSFPKLIG